MGSAASAYRGPSLVAETSSSSDGKDVEQAGGLIPLSEPEHHGFREDPPSKRQSNPQGSFKNSLWFDTRPARCIRAVLFTALYVLVYVFLIRNAGQQRAEVTACVVVALVGFLPVFSSLCHRYRCEGLNWSEISNDVFYNLTPDFLVGFGDKRKKMRDGLHRRAIDCGKAYKDKPLWQHIILKAEERKVQEKSQPIKNHANPEGNGCQCSTERQDDTASAAEGPPAGPDNAPVDNKTASTVLTGGGSTSATGIAVTHTVRLPAGAPHSVPHGSPSVDYYVFSLPSSSWLLPSPTPGSLPLPTLFPL